MSIIARDFTFNKKALSDFSTNYMIVDFDNQSELVAMSRSIQNSMLTNDSAVTYFYGAIGSNIVTFDIAICRADDMPLTVANCKELSDWLMGNPIPKELHFTLCTTGVLNGTYFIGSFTGSRYIQSGNETKQAMIFSFQNISAYGFTREYSYSDITPGEPFVIQSAGSQTGEVIYPRIVILPTDDGTVTINNTDDTSVDAFSIEVENAHPIIIDDRNVFTAEEYLVNVGDNIFVTDYRKDGLYSFSHLNNFNWVGLLDGINTIEITGPATAIIKTRYYKNLGY